MIFGRRRLFMAALTALIMTPMARADQSIAFTTIAQGNQSGVTGYTEAVIHTPYEWEEIWRKHASGMGTPTPPPAVDFSRNMVIAVFFGKVPAGRRTAIWGIVEQDGRLVVLLQMIGPPGPESDDLPQIAPFQIVQLPRSPLPVVFIRTKIPDMYQPGY